MKTLKKILWIQLFLLSVLSTVNVLIQITDHTSFKGLNASEDQQTELAEMP